MGAVACAGVPAARSPSVEPAKVAQLLPSGCPTPPSSFEYERTVHALLGIEPSIAARLPPDVRKDGYTVNADQGMPATWAAQLGAIARDVARRATDAPSDELSRCLRSTNWTNAPPGSACEAWATSLGRRAFRRPLVGEERLALLAAFREGAAAGRGIAGGAELVVTAVLEVLFCFCTSPSSAREARRATS